MTGAFDGGLVARRFLHLEAAAEVLERRTVVAEILVGQAEVVVRTGDPRRVVGGLHHLEAAFEGFGRLRVPP